MNLLMFSQDFKPGPGGIAEIGHQLARGLTRMGDHVVVVAPQMKGAEEFDASCGYPVVRISGGDRTRRWPWQRVGRHLARRRAIEAVIREHDIKHVFFGEWGPLSWSVSRWAKKLGLSYSMHIHGMEITDDFTVAVRPPRARDGLKGAERVFAYPAFLVEVVASLGVPREKICLSYPAVDPTEFTPGEVSEEEKKELGLSGRRVVLTVCRLVERKGVDRSLEAMVEVSKKVPEVMYVISGDGPDRGRLEKMTDNLGLRGRVQFVGYRQGADLLRLYRACDVFLMPAREMPGGDVETFGIVFLEANGCAKPAVAGRSGGMPEAVLDGETGLVVKPEDSGAIAEAVTRLLTDRELARRLGQQGRKRVEGELSWEVRTRKIRDELKKAGVRG